MKLSDLKVNPNNPRTIRDARFKKLCDSIRDFPKMMAIRPIVIDKADGNKILGGNMRYNALRALKFTEIPDEWVRDAAELTEDEKRRFIVEDNMPFGEWDFDVLANSFDTSDLIEWGFEEKELGVLSKMENEPGTILKDKNKLRIHHQRLAFWNCFSLYDKNNLNWEVFKNWKDTHQIEITQEIGNSMLPFILNSYDFITHPPGSKSRGEFYSVSYLCQWLSEKTGIKFILAFRERKNKSRHGRHESLSQEMPELIKDFSYQHKSFLILDDFLNTGTTMKFCFEQLSKNRNHIDGLVFAADK